MRGTIVLVLMGASLASCMETGQSSPQYFNLSDGEISKLQDAGVHGCGACSLRLAQYYEMGKQDNAAALRWYKRSAEDGNSHGMYEYGLFMSEKDDPDSKDEGRQWLEKAKAAGDSQAEDHLRVLDSRHE